MKICIELNEEMLEKWNQTKHDLEDVFEYVGKHIPITDNIMFQCLLFCYEEGDIEALPIYFTDSYIKKIISE
jgi:hypothetical protein